MNSGCVHAHHLQHQLEEARLFLCGVELPVDVQIQPPLVHPLDLPAINRFLQDTQVGQHGMQTGQQQSPRYAFGRMCEHSSQLGIACGSFVPPEQPTCDAQLDHSIQCHLRHSLNINESVVHAQQL